MSEGAGWKKRSLLKAFKMEPGPEPEEQAKVRDPVFSHLGPEPDHKTNI